MSSDGKTAAPGDGRLAPVHRWILAGWAAVAVGLFVAVVLTVDDASGWEDLVVFLAVVFLVIALVIVGLTWLVIRFFVESKGARTLVALLGPPLAGIVAALFPRITG